MNQPTFPLNNPHCRHCESNAGTVRYIVRPTNQNGNGGRPYYACSNCDQSNPEGGWITWDDNHGINATNPFCDCGVVSRLDQAGANSTRLGAGNVFYTCATGACNFYQ
ncbi:uncharacterized protein BDR25DRAFT_251433 [Lindgomyces ingoldianus]|uniref:Uncharacterized protein n=1 Tax=Lindgomyces ingoldianus TaxID=673940 RepID=A0ACB6RDZ2_9PLEO|nr:uncharacterized protein BDR25DRAFT_251433 [Lindgomyces ingoldianus]KAF2476963.1 hypothetical protein BDR25DRAFT_251433 [Lindgomyces ingoldianus]